MRHFYNEISGWAAFSRLYIEMVAEAPDPAHFVEVGSWLGRSAALMAVEIVNSKKQIKFDCIDPWTDGGPDLRHTAFFKTQTVPIYDQFISNLAPVWDRINAMRMTSLEAARTYADASLDFVMLDGDHSYDAVRADIAAFLPKMKSGSVLSGDDFEWPGVKRAVTEAFHGGAHVRWVHRDPSYLLSASYWMVRVS